MRHSLVFWSRWIEAVCVLSIVFGAALAFAPQAMQSTLGAWIYSTMTGESGLGTLTEGELAVHNLLYGLLGAVMIGWMVAIAWIAHIPFRRGERWAWWALDSCLVIWFVVDGIVSATHGMPLNILFNTGFLILFGIPLLATLDHFRPLARIPAPAT